MKRCLFALLAQVAIGCGIDRDASSKAMDVAAEPAPFRDSVAFDTALSWISRPGRFSCPTSYGNDSYRYVADLIATTGVRHVRERLRWKEVAPTKEKWNPGHYLENAEMLSKRGLRVSGMFHDTAKYARPNRCLPRDPIATFDFCRRLAETFGDRMEMWEFWNEEDIGFTNEAAWEYATQLKAAVLGFRAGGFGGIVAPGAFCREIRGGYDETFLKNDPMKYVDVVNFHTYCSPKQYPEVFRNLRDMFARHGVCDRAVVLTECGTNQEGNSDTDGNQKGLKAHSPDQEKVQEEFIVKSQILTRMEGVWRNYFFVFGAFNERGGKKDWGLIRRDGTVKPAVAAVKRLVDEVGEGNLAGEVEVPGGKVRAFRFDFPGGSSKLVYWKRSEIDDAAKEVRRWVDDPVECAIPLANGETLRLVARRCADYVNLPASVDVVRKPLPAGRVGVADDPTLDRSVVMRIDFDEKGYTLGGNKSHLELKNDAIDATLEVWNLEDAPKTGKVEFLGGGRVSGLPPSLTLPARGKAEVRLRYHVSGDDGTGLLFGGRFEGRRISVLAVPVFSEQKYMKSCDVVECGWRDLKRWVRNTSAKEYSCEWDEQEKAVRFHFKWDGKTNDQWFFPGYLLDLPRESLSKARLITYEARSAQDKVENDYSSARMWVKGKKRSSMSFLNPVPVGTWEVRRQEVGDVIRECDATRIEFGGHPKGHDVTYWIRNVRIFTEKGSGDASK